METEGKTTVPGLDLAVLAMLEQTSPRELVRRIFDMRRQPGVDASKAMRIQAVFVPFQLIERYAQQKGLPI